MFILLSIIKCLIKFFDSQSLSTNNENLYMLVTQRICVKVHSMHFKRLAKSVSCLALLVFPEFSLNFNADKCIAAVCRRTLSIPPCLTTVFSRR
jgi:hypothetical protein